MTDKFSRTIYVIKCEWRGEPVTLGTYLSQHSAEVEAAKLRNLRFNATVHTREVATMTDIDHLAFIRRAEITIAEFVNANQGGLEVTYNGGYLGKGYFHWEPEEFGREADEVVRDLATMSIVHGHNITREVAITELMDTRAIQQTTPSLAVELASALVDELGVEMLFLEEE